MKLIEKTGSKLESANSIKTKQFGLFECPVCKAQVERPLTHGRRNKSCGKRECRKATLKWNPPIIPKIVNPIKVNNKLTSRNSLRYFDAFRLWYNRLDKTKLCPTITTLEKAADVFYTAYEALKLQYPNQPITIALYDPEKLITKDNWYFTLISKSTGLSVLENQIITMSRATRINKNKIAKIIGSKELDTEEYDELFNKLVYEKYAHSKETEYLYLVKADKYIKIGVAKNPESRLISISTGCPFKPEIVLIKKLDKLCFLVERYLHIKFTDKRCNGEWFELTSEDIAYIDSTSEETLVNEAAKEVASNKQAYIETTRTYTNSDKLDKLRKEAEERYLKACENYEELKRKMRDKNKKPKIETIHEWDERFAHDRTNQIKSTTTHGMSHTDLYKTWQNMKKVYGVSEEWQTFEPFREVVEKEYGEYTEEQAARVYPLVVGVPIGPTNYKVESKFQHEVKSGVAKAVEKLGTNEEVLALYGTVMEAAKAVDGIASKISAVCKGTRKTHAGFKWRYKE